MIYFSDINIKESDTPHGYKKDYDEYLCKQKEVTELFYCHGNNAAQTLDMIHNQVCPGTDIENGDEAASFWNPSISRGLKFTFNTTAGSKNGRLITNISQALLTLPTLVFVNTKDLMELVEKNLAELIYNCNAIKHNLSTIPRGEHYELKIYNKVNKPDIQKIFVGKHYGRKMRSVPGWETQLRTTLEQIQDFYPGKDVIYTPGLSYRIRYELSDPAHYRWSKTAHKIAQIILEERNLTLIDKIQNNRL